MEAVVLAGGRGTRLRPVVADRPKPMAPVAGRPFLEYLLDYWIGQGVDRFILSVGYMKEAIVDHFGRSYRTATVDYAVEETPRGTGGGLLLGLGMVDGARAVAVNGDTYFEADLAALERDRARRGSTVTVACATVERNTRYGGVRIGAGERIVSLDDPDGGVRPINGGVYLLDRGVADRFALFPNRSPLSLERDLLPSLIDAGEPVHATVFADALFVDIGTPESYSSLERLLSGRKDETK